MHSWGSSEYPTRVTWVSFPPWQGMEYCII